MENMLNAISWVEIPALDFERAKAFYSSIYEYEMPVMDMGGTLLGMLPHDPEKGVGGAIISGDHNTPAKNGVRVYLNGGDDLNNVLNRVEAAGGKIVLAKTQITPEMGNHASFEDTEGNVIALFSQN